MKLYSKRIRPSTPHNPKVRGSNLLLATNTTKAVQVIGKAYIVVVVARTLQAGDLPPEY